MFDLLTLDRTGWLILAACVLSILNFIVAEHMAKTHGIGYEEARKRQRGGFYMIFLICGLLIQLLACLD